MIQHRAPISGVDAGPRSWIATAGYDNRVILWDAEQRAGVACANHDHLANQCRFSACGRLLVSASSDYTARIWAVPTLELLGVLRGHDDDVEMAVFSPDGRRVATASRDHRVRIFDLDGRMLACLDGHTADVISVEWSADGRALVSSSDDGTVRRWCADSHRLLATVELGELEADTVVHGSGGVLHVGTDAGEIVTLRDGVAAATPAHRSGIKRLVIHPATRTLLSAGYDRAVKLWRIGGRGELTLRRTLEAPPPVWLRSCAFAGASRLVFGTFGSGFASYDLATDAWDLTRVGDTPGVNAVRAHRGAIYTIGDAGVLRRDGFAVRRLGSLCNFLVPFAGRLVTGGHLGILYDAETGAELHRHRSPLNCGATFHRDGVEHLVVGAYTGECLVLRAGDPPALVAELVVHDNAVKGVACNARQLFTVCATGAAAVTSIAQLARDRLIPRAHDRISNGAAALPDGRFVSVSRDRRLRVWSTDAARVIATPHSHSIKCVAVCPHSGLIATGGYDGMVAVYDDAAARWVTVERPTTAGISSLCPAGRPGEFLAGSYDGEVYTLAADARSAAA